MPWHEPPGAARAVACDLIGHPLPTCVPVRLHAHVRHIHARAVHTAGEHDAPLVSSARTDLDGAVGMPVLQAKC